MYAIVVVRFVCKRNNNNNSDTNNNIKDVNVYGVFIDLPWTL